jgi:2-dehydro-3-deoxyphosphogluconate aldolase/(4S)-4-hydroxy-2-oxoglutarate aldolase
LSGECPNVLAGAGTVLTPGQAKEARDAGAKFIVSPGLNPQVVEYCLEHGMPVYPGIATPTEIETALRLGLSVLKFFPAEPLGGVSYLKAISAPYGSLSFMPTGGVSAANVGSYLAFSKVIACGGSWMAPSEWIAAAQFDRITNEVKAAVAAVKPEQGATTR